MLDIVNLSSGYGKTVVCRNINIHVDPGALVSVVGANGAGKTTLLNSIAGIVHKFGGEVRFDGNDITKLSSYDIVTKGLILAAGMESLFTPLTVYENLLVSLYPFRKLFTKEQTDQQLQEVYQLFPRLYERRNQKAGTLSGGERQMLSLAKALVTKPKLLMLDEPSLGLAPVVIDELFETISRIAKEQGLTVLIVEQNVDRALAISDRGYVLDVGEIVMEETAEHLLNDAKVKQIYLGMA